jgi:predicted N-acetyltransferase YhbS
MVDWAEAHLGGYSRSLERNVLGIYVNDFDEDFAGELTGRGFERFDDYQEEHARFVVDGPIPDVEAPEGFRLQSLADENDLVQINRVLWRGFNHEGPPPDAEIAGRAFAQSAPSFRKDLTIVAAAPNGDYAAFGGMWFVPENRVAYVEPVATDPTYRRLGVGSAVVLESMRRVAELGAEVIWVGSGQQFYRNLGFTVMFQGNLWVRNL